MSLTVPRAFVICILRMSFARRVSPNRDRASSSCAFISSIPLIMLARASPTLRPRSLLRSPLSPAVAAAPRAANADSRFLLERGEAEKPAAAFAPAVRFSAGPSSTAPLTPPPPPPVPPGVSHRRLRDPGSTTLLWAAAATDADADADDAPCPPPSSSHAKPTSLRAQILSPVSVDSSPSIQRWYWERCSLTHDPRPSFDSPTRQ
mmetsp:Transcript_38121/g.113930  ORF Transcript_38121/g.113930 Transcript_38121/m.113930 type:complete len:205 (+) Transcript_38121:55-669(+)